MGASIRGMPNNSTEKRLIGFVVGRLVHGITSIELVHCTDEGDNLLRDYKVGSSDVEAGQVVREILEEAAEHAECYPMPQRFAIQAFMANTNVHCGMCQFLLRPSRSARAPLGALTEPPTERGLIAQLMRHTEAACSVNVELSRSMATMYQARAEMAETSFHKYVAEKEKWAGFSAEEAEKAHQRKMQAEEAAREHEIIKVGMEQIGPVFRALGPYVARRLDKALGGDGKPAAPPPPPAPAPPPPPGPPSRSATSSPSPPSAAPPENRTSRDHEKEEESEEQKQTSATPTSEEKMPADARRARLEAILSQITEEEAAKLETALGEDKAAELVHAVVGMLQ